MIEIEIPGFRCLRLAHLLLDYNGTLAVNGDLIDGMKSRLNELVGSLSTHQVPPSFRTHRQVQPLAGD